MYIDVGWLVGTRASTRMISCRQPTKVLITLLYNKIECLITLRTYFALIVHEKCQPTLVQVILFIYTNLYIYEYIHIPIYIFYFFYETQHFFLPQEK